MTTIVNDLLTNAAYGFPSRGDPRRITPKVLAVVHITANLASAANQRQYANRAGSPGPSAHYYIDRDGGGVHAIDERRYAAWSNGDMQAPALGNAGVAYLAKLRADGVHNANEGCYLEIEGVGEATPAGQWTDVQFETVARLIAGAAQATGLAINDTTVLPHAWINSIDRAHCPSLNPGAHIAKLVAMATPSALPQEELVDLSDLIYTKAAVVSKAGTPIFDAPGGKAIYGTKVDNEQFPEVGDTGSYHVVRLAGSKAGYVAHGLTAAPVPFTDPNLPAQADTTHDVRLTVDGIEKAKVIV